MSKFPIFDSLRRPYVSFLGAVMIGLFVMGVAMAIYLISNFYESGMLFNDSFKYKIMNLETMHLINIQVIQMLCFFILPPLIYAYFHKKNTFELYQLNRKVNIVKLFYGVIFALSIFPVLIFIQDWAVHLPYPADLRILAEKQKAASELILEKFLTFSSPLKLLGMVLIMGIGAGVTEELFFRGLLMPLLGRFFKNIWVGMILSGLIFGALHSSVYDLIPISIIGVLFGFIYLKTQNLWLTIFIHAFYNSAQVVLNYLYTNKYIQFDIDSLENIPIFVVLPCAFLATFIFKKITQTSIDE